MVRILTFRDPVCIDDPSQCCVNQAGPHQPWPLSRFAESLSKKRPERKGALHQGVRLAGAMARRGPWRKATHRTVHSTLRDTRKLCRHRLGVGSRSRRHHRPYDRERVGSTERRREKTGSRRRRIHAASWVRTTRRGSREGPRSSIALRCSGSDERVCSIEFTHSESSFSVAVHLADN